MTDNQEVQRKMSGTDTHTKEEGATHHGKTKVSLRDGLMSMVEWIREHGTKPFEYHLPIEIDSPLVPATWRDRLI